MATLIDNGARNKLHNMFRLLEDQLPSILNDVGGQVAKEVASRAPSPIVEEKTMMYGGSVGLNDGGSDDRERFVKSPDTFLKNFIPTSYRVDGLYVKIGEIDRLNEISSYEYVNTTRAGSTRHVVTYPFWWAWEVGGVFTITPRFTAATGGRGYPLRPTPNDQLWRMTKIIPPTYMYSSVSYEDVVERILLPRIRRLINKL